MNRKLFSIVDLILMVLIAISVFIFLKYTLMWPALYENGRSLDPKENQEIKSLLLSAIKNQHSKPFSVDGSKLYTEERWGSMQQNEESPWDRSLFVRIDPHFMGSVQKADYNVDRHEYTAEVQMIGPVDWHYFFTIKVINGQYVITDYGIDP